MPVNNTQHASLILLAAHILQRLGSAFQPARPAHVLREELRQIGDLIAAQMDVPAVVPAVRPAPDAAEQLPQPRPPQPRPFLANSPGTPPPSPRACSQQQHSQFLSPSSRADRTESVRLIRAKLEQFPQKCGYCWMRGLDSQHSGLECQLVAPRRSLFRGTNNFVDYTACWRCGKPDDFCGLGCDGANGAHYNLARDLLLAIVDMSHDRRQLLFASAPADVRSLERNPQGTRLPSCWLRRRDAPHSRKMYFAWALTETAALIFA